MVLGIDSPDNKVEWVEKIYVSRPQQEAIRVMRRARNVNIEIASALEADWTKTDHQKPRQAPSREEVARARPAALDSRDRISNGQSIEPRREVEPGNSGNEMRLS
jgi:hypothetical protein